MSGVGSAITSALGGSAPKPAAAPPPPPVRVASTAPAPVQTLSEGGSRPTAAVDTKRRSTRRRALSRASTGGSAGLFGE